MYPRSGTTYPRFTSFDYVERFMRDTATLAAQRAPSCWVARCLCPRYNPGGGARTPLRGRAPRGEGRARDGGRGVLALAWR